MKALKPTAKHQRDLPIEICIAAKAALNERGMNFDTQMVQTVWEVVHDLLDARRAK